MNKAFILREDQTDKVNRKAMIRNLYDQIQHPTLRTKRTQKVINVHKKHAQQAECIVVSQTSGHLATLIENCSNIYFHLFSILDSKTEQNRNHNGQLLSVEHIAEDHLHTDITCNIEEVAEVFSFYIIYG